MFLSPRYILSGLFIPLLLSGCTFHLNKEQEDYSGSNAAMLRVENGDMPLILRSYRTVGNCYQQTVQRGLTAGFNLMGIKSTYNKKIAGIAPSPEDSKVKNSNVMEFRIKADQPIEVMYMITVKRAFGEQLIQSSKYLIPEAGHSYEAWLDKKPDNNNPPIMIKDITSGKSNAPAAWALTECKHTYTLLGNKEYK